MAYVQSLSQMDFPILISRTCPFQFGCFFLLILKEHTVSEHPYQTLHHAASVLGLHYLPMSHKKDARLLMHGQLSSGAKGQQEPLSGIEATKPVFGGIRHRETQTSLLSNSD